MGVCKQASAWGFASRPLHLNPRKDELPVSAAAIDSCLERRREIHTLMTSARMSMRILHRHHKDGAKSPSHWRAMMVGASFAVAVVGGVDQCDPRAITATDDAGCGRFFPRFHPKNAKPLAHNNDAK